MKKHLYWLLLLVCGTYAQAQTPKSPKDFLGYELGEAFTYHHRMVAYFEYMDAASDRVKVVHYGATTERRPLIGAFISSPENLAKLEEYRQNNLKSASLMEGQPGKQIPFVWLSYNIHGNESVSMEAAMKVLYNLASLQEKSAEEWLKEVIVVIDPCENPDGRDRYTNWYNQANSGASNNIDSDTWEHNEPWPGGRYNHYLFDLNRDWAWQTQLESRQRIAFYQQYMPHIHVDLHEMGINSPYFFGPSAEPFHKTITPWQREMHRLSGINHAKYFDEQGWRYFTKEIFDLFYPSYGDTWPTFNGAIGFTYEQGGSGRAGLAVATADGDTLTLADRIAHHYTSSISTIEVGYQQREKLLQEFNQYFKKGLTSPAGKFRSYVIKGTNSAYTLKALGKLLDQQGIQYGLAKGGKKSLSGFDYQNNKQGSFELSDNDLIISAFQPQHNMVNVLFEPNPEISDSLTYDMTAWALPYIYGVEAYATETRLEVGEKPAQEKANAPLKKAYAYLVAWNDVANVRFLAALHREGIRVRFAEEPFKAKGQAFQRGTLAILRGDNKYMPQFEERMTELANEYGQEVTALASGLVEEGKDFGSEVLKRAHAPNVAIINGDGVSATAFGEVWHYFEEQIGYPVSVIQSTDLSDVNLLKYDVVILPDGRYGSFEKQLAAFAKNGGKIIAMDGAVRLFEKMEGTLLGKMFEKANAGKPDPTGDALLRVYGNRERDRVSQGVEGSIYRVYLDKTHPLGFGVQHNLHLAKRNSRLYHYLPEGGWNVGVYKADSYTAGFVGGKLKTNIHSTLALGLEEYGDGQIIYFPDSPAFRAFWHSGKLVLGNAVFLVGQ